MNLPQILESLDECDRTKFCEAIADASHYVAIALDVLPASDHFSFPELCRALNHLNDLNDEIQAHLCDADDDAGDKALQEAYDIIAADDDADSDAKEMTISQMLKDQWANEKLVGRGWN